MPGGGTPAGGRGVLAGWAAAELLGASCAPPGVPVELVVPGGGRSQPGLVVRSHVLPPEEIAQVDGVQVTSAARTAFDLGRVSPAAHAIMAVDALRSAVGGRARRTGAPQA